MSLTQIQLAAALGLSQSAVSQLAKQGMPTNSIAAARAWRETHLHPGRAKPAPRAPSLSALLEEAEALLDVGGDIGPLMPDLRLALRQAPADQRAAVAMSEDLWDSLTAPIGHAFKPERGAALTPAQVDEMGGFWYAMAAGESWMP
jgi:transcriptional regulator with XRE-family HTH domain